MTSFVLRQTDVFSRNPPHAAIVEENERGDLLVDFSVQNLVHYANGFLVGYLNPSMKFASIPCSANFRVTAFPPPCTTTTLIPMKFRKTKSPLPLQPLLRDRASP